MKTNDEAILDPLQIQFGFGRVAVCGFRDKYGVGIMFSDCGKSHDVGDKWEHGKSNPHTPEKGSIYLHFTNTESLDVVLDALLEAKQDLIATRASKALEEDV